MNQKEVCIAHGEEMDRQMKKRCGLDGPASVRSDEPKSRSVCVAQMSMTRKGGCQWHGK